MAHDVTSYPASIDVFDAAVAAVSRGISPKESDRFNKLQTAMVATQTKLDAAFVPDNLTIVAGSVDYDATMQSVTGTFGAPVVPVAGDLAIHLRGVNVVVVDTASFALASGVGGIWEWAVALGDEGTAATTGVKSTFRMSRAVLLNTGNLGLRLSCNTASTSGIVTVDVKRGGVTILSTLLTLDINERTSLTAAVPVVITTPGRTLLDDEEITVEVTIAGTGTKGLKMLMRGVIS